MQTIRSQFASRATLLSTWLAVIAGALLSTVLSVSAFYAHEEAPSSQAGATITHASIGTAAALGAFVLGQDRHSGQLTTMRLAIPGRNRLFFARLVTALVFFVLAAVLTITPLVIDSWRSGPDLTEQWPRIFLLTAVALTAGALVDITGNSVLALFAILCFLWLAPLTRNALPALDWLLPCKAVAELEKGNWPTQAIPGIAWPLAIVMTALTRFQRE